MTFQIRKRLESRDPARMHGDLANVSKKQVRNTHDFDGGKRFRADSFAESLIIFRRISAFFTAQTCVYDPQEDKPIHVLEGHEGIVWSTAISSDSKLIVSSSDDSTIRTWDVKTGKQMESFIAHEGAVMCVDINKGNAMIASGGGWDDKSFKLWSRDSRQKGKKKPLLTDVFLNSVRAVQFSPDGNKVVGASQCANVAIWDTKTLDVLQQYTEHSDAVYAAAWSSDSKLVATGGMEGTIHVWDAAKGKSKMDPLRGHNGAITTLAMDSKTEILVSGSFDKTIKVWEFDRKKWKAEVKHTLKGHKDVLRSVALSPNNRFIASGSEDGAIMIWEISTGHLVKILTGHSEGIWSVKWSLDGKFIISGSRDATIRVWSIDQQVLLSSFFGILHAMLCMYT
jgi:WD40 repeat protein